MVRGGVAGTVGFETGASSASSNASECHCDYIRMNTPKECMSQHVTLWLIHLHGRVWLFDGPLGCGSWHHQHSDHQYMTCGHCTASADSSRPADAACSTAACSTDGDLLNGERVNSGESYQCCGSAHPQCCPGYAVIVLDGLADCCADVTVLLCVLRAWFVLLWQARSKAGDSHVTLSVPYILIILVGFFNW